MCGVNTIIYNKTISYIKVAQHCISSWAWAVTEQAKKTFESKKET